MEEKQKLKNAKGITLVALVVTIIVLIILAGVSISLVLGENGIITKAKQAKQETIVETEEEAIKLAYNAAMIKKIANQDNSPVTAQELNDELKLEGVIVTGSKVIDISSNNTGKKYEIYEDGDFVEVPTEDMSHIYEYDTTGYITGIKPEYFERVTTGKINKGIKIASLNKLKLGVTIVPQREDFKLKEEIGTYLVIPEEINGTSIIGIGYPTSAREMIGIGLGMINLKYIKLPNTITYIDSHAFSYTGLKNVRIPDSVTNIEKYAFDSVSIKNIYCEAESKPDGWEDGWDERRVEKQKPIVHWGVEM